MTDWRPPKSAAYQPTQDLVQAAKAGDQEAYRILDERNRFALMLVVRGTIPRSARSRLDTEEVVQSAMIAGFMEIESFEYRGKGSFQSWLRRILHNRTLQKLRRHRAERRDVEREVQASDLDAETGSHSETGQPIEALSRLEQRARLLEAISELPDDYRQAIMLRYYDGIPVTRICVQLAISRRSVHRHLAHGFEMLLRKLQ